MTEYVFQQNDRKEEQVKTVTPGLFYTPERGYGYFTKESANGEKILTLPELNTGFYLEEGDVKGPKWGIPVSFLADVDSPGTYWLTVELEAKEEETEVLVFAARRQLVFKGSMSAHVSRTFSFPITLTDFIPGDTKERHPCRFVSVTVISQSVGFKKITVKKWKGTTIYLAGDSTVTDQCATPPYQPGTSYGGWGQMLPAFIGELKAVSNHAHSGLTTESFRAEGHFEIMMESVRPGDVCLFQFGHNDQKLKHLKAEEGYRENLIEYIKEVQKKGAFPVLVTPLARNSWNGKEGSYRDLLEEYAGEVINIGKEESVPVADLHRKSMEFLKQHGLEDSKRWFYPSDYTHTNDYGAYQMAKFLCEELSDLKILPPNLNGFGDWEPLKSNNDNRITNKINLVSDLERPEEALSRAEALDFVIRTVNFFPMNTYHTSFLDVAGDEWYAGVVACGVQNGLITCEMTREGRFYPDKEVTLEEFLWMAMTGYLSRKSVKQSLGPEIEGTLFWTKKMVSIACGLGMADPDDDWKRCISRKEAAALLDGFEL